MTWEIGIGIYTLLCIKWTTENLLYTGNYSMLFGDPNGKEIQKRRKYTHTHTHTHTADSLCYAAEINTTFCNL